VLIRNHFNVEEITDDLNHERVIGGEDRFLEQLNTGIERLLDHIDDLDLPQDVKKDVDGLTSIIIERYYELIADPS